MEILQENLIQALIASVGGCLLRYLVDYKDGKKPHLILCIMDCIAATFLGYYVYLYVIEEMHLSILHGLLLNILVGYVGADGVNIAKSFIIKRVMERLNVQEKENEVPK